MKYLLHRILLLMVYMGIVFSACTDPMVVDPKPGDETEDVMIPLVIKMKDLFPPSTRGTDYPGVTDVPGSSWEDDIEDVTVYIFDNTFMCEKIATVSAPFYSGYVGPIMVKAGYKNLVAVVNSTSGNVTLPATEATTNYTALLTMLTNPIITTPTSPFLMTGKLLNVHLKDGYSYASPFDTTIYVERACAKITMNVTKSGLSASHNIVLTKIAMYQGANQVALLHTPAVNPTLYTLSDSTTLFNPATGTVPNQGYGYCAMADSFYTYESLCGSDKSKAVKLVIEAYVNSPSNIRHAEFYLGEYLKTPGDTTYDVLRNYWYVINVDIVKPGLDSIYVDIKACPWNVADTMVVIPGQGAEFTPALPLKLVQNYTAAVLANPATRQYAAINKHSKGASWIDVKALPGTSWQLLLSDASERNQDVWASINGGASWSLFPVSGSGDSTRVYIYRPYKENNEPPLGPMIYATVGGKYKEGFVIQPRDTVPIPTNCYILRAPLAGTPTNESVAYIPLAGVYNVWENNINDMNSNRECITIPTGNIYADIAWDYPVGAVVSNPLVIHADKRDSAYLVVQAIGPGNATVNMRIGWSGGVIYWTFHIWVTEYNPYEAAGQKFGDTGSPNNIKNVFMDRNLGAMSNVYDAGGSARGLLYQFGRKDPFCPSLTFSNIAQPIFPTSFRPLNAISQSIWEPLFFWRIGGNWALSLEDSCLWNTAGGNKTAYDPCPEGWRIPVQDGVNTPWGGALEASFSPDVVYAGGANSTVLGYFPLGGYINGSGAITAVGTTNYLWSSFSTTNPSSFNSGSGLEIRYSPFFSGIPGSLDKSYGASVRCVVDKNYIFRKENGNLFGSEVSRLRNELQ